MQSIKRVLQFIILTCALLLMCVGASAKTNSMIDQAHILTAQQRTQLAQQLAAIERKHNIRLAVITVKSIKGNNLAKYCNNVLDKNYTEGKNGNMLLLLDMQKKSWHISTDKKMEKRLPNNAGIQVLKQEITPLLKKNSFAPALQRYAAKTDELLTYYEQNGKPYGVKTASAAPAKKAAKKDSFNMLALVGALLCGGIAAYLRGNSLKASMSNVALATEANDYLQKDSFQITSSDDSFMYITVAVVPHGSRREHDTDHGDGYHGGDSDSFGDEGSSYDTFDTDFDDGGSFDDSEP